SRSGGFVTAGLEVDFEALVRLHQNALYRYGRGLGLDHDTALDLVQEAFVKAHARLSQCREPGRVRSWLFRIFRNTMLDWARNVRRTEVPLLDVEEPADEEDFAERHALREAIGAALQSAVKAGIPVSLLERKVAEGEAKGVAMARIAVAVEHRLDVLTQAQDALLKAGLKNSTEGELSVAADAVQAGVSQSALVAISQRAPDNRRT